MGIWPEIAHWTETRLEKGKRVRKARGKETGEEKVARVISKEKERGRETFGEKGSKGITRGRAKAKEKVTTGEHLLVERDTRGFAMIVEKEDIRLGKDCAKFKE